MNLVILNVHPKIMDVCNAEYLMKKAVGWIMIAYIFMRAIIVGTRLLWGQFGILPSMWGQNKKKLG